MKSVNDDGLKILIEMQRIKRKYDGRFEFLRRITDLQKGTLIELVVEEKLVESFAKDGNALRIGTSGLVVFEDRTAPKKSAKAEQELEETKKLLQELEERQKTLQRQVDAQKAAEAEKEARESLGSSTWATKRRTARARRSRLTVCSRPRRGPRKLTVVRSER
jgi:hypothetical protein